MALVYTNGFVDAVTLTEHFDFHVTQRQEMDVATEDEYETLADQFLGKPLPRPLDTGMWECYRTRRDGTRGDYIRYNELTSEYGVLSVNNHIRTFFIPNPADHGFNTNLDYFYWDCRRVRG